MRRLMIWIMPAHRKDWGAAMLNECAYIKSRRKTFRWIVGIMLFTLKERTIYELEKTFMNMKTFTSALAFIALAVGFIAGIYAIQKPYQQERIKIALCRFLDVKQI